MNEYKIDCQALRHLLHFQLQNTFIIKNIKTIKISPFMMYDCKSVKQHYEVDIMIDVDLTRATFSNET